MSLLYYKNDRLLCIRITEYNVAMRVVAIFTSSRKLYEECDINVCEKGNDA